jgi:hypothetical protein
MRSDRRGRDGRDDSCNPRVLPDVQICGNQGERMCCLILRDDTRWISIPLVAINGRIYVSLFRYWGYEVIIRTRWLPEGVWWLVQSRARKYWVGNLSSKIKTENPENTYRNIRVLALYKKTFPWSTGRSFSSTILLIYWCWIDHDMMVTVNCKQKSTKRRWEQFS